MLCARASDRADRARLMRSDWRELQADLRKTPRDFGLPATLWDGPVLSEHLRRRYAVDLGVRQCQRLFRQMEFRLRKPRPQVAQSDPLKVAAVKKTPSSGSSSPTSNCGAWMNVTSSNMVRVAACGYRRKSRTRFCAMRRPASPWLALGPSVWTAASSCA